MRLPGRHPFKLVCSGPGPPRLCACAWPTLAIPWPLPHRSSCPLSPLPSASLSVHPLHKASQRDSPLPQARGVGRGEAGSGGDACGKIWSPRGQGEGPLTWSSHYDHEPVTSLPASQLPQALGQDEGSASGDEALLIDV